MDGFGTFDTKELLLMIIGGAIMIGSAIWLFKNLK